MENYKVRYKNPKFSNEKVELDGESFVHCEFENCIIREIYDQQPAKHHSKIRTGGKRKCYQRYRSFLRA